MWARRLSSDGPSNSDRKHTSLKPLGAGTHFSIWMTLRGLSDSSRCFRKPRTFTAFEGMACEQRCCHLLEADRCKLSLQWQPAHPSVDSRHPHGMTTFACRSDKHDSPNKKIYDIDNAGHKPCLSFETGVEMLEMPAWRSIKQTGLAEATSETPNAKHPKPDAKPQPSTSKPHRMRNPRPPDLKSLLEGSS